MSSKPASTSRPGHFTPNGFAFTIIENSNCCSGHFEMSDWQLDVEADLKFLIQLLCLAFLQGISF